MTLDDENGVEVRVTMDATGRGSVPAPRAGIYRVGVVDAHGGKLWPMHRAVEIGASGRTGTDVVVVDGLTATLVALDADAGTPLPRVVFKAVPQSDSYRRRMLKLPEDLLAKATNAEAIEGVLTLPLSDEVMYGYVGCEGYAWEPVALSPEGPRPAVVPLFKSSSLKVTLAGKGETVEVRLRHLPSERGDQFIFRPDTASHAWEQLPAGAYEVRARYGPRATQRVLFRALSLQAGVPASLELPARASDDRSGRVKCRMEVPPAWGLRRVGVGVYDAIEHEVTERVEADVVDGRCVFDLHPSSRTQRLLVGVDPAGWVQPLDVGTAGSEVRVLRLPEPTTLRMRVGGGSSAPESGVSWSCVTSGASAHGFLIEGFDRVKAGWHEIRVPVGAVVLEAWAFEDGVSQWANGTAVTKVGESTSVEAQLRPGGALTFSYAHQGRVIPVDATDFAVSLDGEIFCRGEEGDIVGRVDGLRAGKLVLEVQPPTGFHVARVPFEVPLGGELHVRVELTARAK